MQILAGAGSIDLTVAITMLQCTIQPSSPATFYTVDLPPGNQIGQWKQILVPGSVSNATAPFGVFGTFANGISALLFNSAATSATLAWDGSSWQLMGGNAAPTPLTHP